jgi:ATP-binding cassette subfamily B (MDR/TAP) protein 1
LFAGTIGDNIAYGLNDEHTTDKLGSSKVDSTNLSKLDHINDSMEKIISAAKLANAHDFITHLPNGYETDVGSNGVAMSGGQKQRIAIARALIKKPAVLLLDEATSALDATSEKIVQQSIDALAQSKAQTTIIIAHRLSTIRNADKIIVVDAGEIVEIGNHVDLIAKNGKYADLVRLQMDSSEGNKEMCEIVDTYIEDLPSAGDITQIDAEEIPPLLNDDPPHNSHLQKHSEQTPDEIAEVKKEKNLVIKKIRAIVFQHPWLIFTGSVGAMLFGGVFPGKSFEFHWLRFYVKLIEL